MFGGVVAVAIAAIGIAIGRRAGRSDSAPVVAIGHIADYRGEASDDMTAPLTDMLATNLARASSLRVVSSARMLEMLARARNERDTTAVHTRAAQLAGATQMIEGTLVALQDGGYRLDLRRVTLADGTINDAQTVRGADLFALADSGSARLLAAFGSELIAGSIADVTTRSLPAYRLYMRGLQRYQAGDSPAARELFEAALSEDSTFAMAAYWAAVSVGYDWRSPERRHMLAHIDRAVRLSAGASDRERLIIRTWWARATNSPSLRAIADTLSRRYPEELDGHVQAGAAAILAGDFLGAATPLERAIRLDSVVLSTGVQRCGGCSAIDLLIRAWVAADSMAAAERVARRAVRIWPRNAMSLALLAEVLDYQGRFDEAEAVIDSAAALPASTINMWARHWIRAGRFDRLDPMLSQHIASSGQQGNLLYWSAMSLRNQGRFDEALATARRFRALTGEPGDTKSSAPQSAAIEAQVLLESGKAAASAALFDSIAAWRLAGQPEASHAANRVWMLTQEATARADAGDAPAVASLADSVEALGARTYTERDRRLHHHVRGLEAMLRGDVAAAIDHFQRAMYSTTIGYNRTNYELAKALLRRGRPREAIAVLRPAARGVVLESANVHLTLADVHALLAQAFATAGQADSARVHGRWAHASAAGSSSR
jgi:tetratricopeptide (TPR) repeat protein